MSKKSKFMAGKPFPVETCDAIRHHNGMATQLQQAREEAFTDRKAALAELNEFSDHESKEAIKVKARHSDAVVRIDSLDKRIKWHEKRLSNYVVDPDQVELDFMYDMPDEDEQKKKADDEQGKFGKDTRPVGRPGRKPAPEIPDPSKGDGIDEHLNASVNELDIPEKAKGALIAAGYDTIAKVAAFVEKYPGDNDIRETEWDVDAKTARSIVAQMQKYRSAHRKAAMAAEGVGA